MSMSVFTLGVAVRPKSLRYSKMKFNSSGIRNGSSPKNKDGFEYADNSDSTGASQSRLKSGGVSTRPMSRNALCDTPGGVVHNNGSICESAFISHSNGSTGGGAVESSLRVTSLLAWES